jgi:GT2 family glycosyltransferase
MIYLKQENRGPAAARNLGILRAKGQYLAFLDSDDIWLAEYLETQVKLFEENPSLEMVCCDAQLFGDHPLSGRTFMELRPSTNPVTFESLLKEGCRVLTSCIVARRQTIIDAGLFDEGHCPCEDYDLWLRVAHRGAKIVFQRKALALRREHLGSLSTAMAEAMEDQVRVLRKLKRTLQLREEMRTLLQKRLERYQAEVELKRGKECLLAGNFRRAGNSLRRASVLLHRTGSSQGKRPLLGGNLYQAVRIAKVRLVLIGLRTVPRLTRLAARLAKNLRQVFETAARPLGYLNLTGISSRDGKRQ